MTVDTNKTITRSASKFFYGTLISRFTGVARDIILAFFFGSSSFIAAFMVAFRLANLFRRLFGETSLQAGFVPHFESIKSYKPHDAAYFYRDLLFTMFFILSFVVVASESLLYIFNIYHYDPGVKQIILLVEIMCPGLIFICLYSLNSSLMQCERKYFLPAVAPAIFNIIWIITVLFLKNTEPSKAVIYLSFSVVFGFFAQWLITSVFTFNFFVGYNNVREFFRPKIFSKELKVLIKPMTMGVIGIGATQINTALDAIFSRVADLSGPAYLWYAMRLQQLPLALFGIAISGAILPPLSRAVGRGDEEGYKSFMNLSIRRTIAFMVPSTFGIIAIGGASINLLFGRGEFGEASIINTLHCLWAYGLGLIFSTFTLVFSSAFYAKKQYTIPTRSSVYAVIINIILNSVFVFVFHWKATSIAIATSASALFNFVFLIVKYKYKIFDKDMLRFTYKVLFCNGLSFVLTISFGWYVLHDPTLLIIFNKVSLYHFPTTFLSQFSSFAVLSTTYLSSLIIFAYITKTDEILKMLRIKKSR